MMVLIEFAAPPALALKDKAAQVLDRRLAEVVRAFEEVLRVFGVQPQLPFVLRPGLLLTPLFE
jgi:hypothetical protein